MFMVPSLILRSLSALIKDKLLGGSVFYVLLFEAYFRFLDFKGPFFSLIFEFLKF